MKPSTLRKPAIDSESAPAQLSALLASSHDPVIGLSARGKILTWNPAAEKLYGRSAREIKGKTLALITQPGRRREIGEALSEVRRGKPVREFLSIGIGKDGQEFNVMMNLTPVTDGHGRVVEVLAVVRDITRRIRGRETILRRNRELLTFHKLSEIVLSSRSLEESYCDVVEEIRSATGFPIVSIGTVEEGGETLAFHGLHAGRSRSRESVIERPLRKTLAGIVVQTGKPLITTRVRSYPRYRGSVIRNMGARTFIGYPMTARGKIIGCLNLAHTGKVEVSQESRQWIEGLANYVAVLTERRRAEEELRTSREQLRQLSNRTRSAIEEERKRIAREIHDELGQDLSLLQLDVGLLRSRLPETEKDLRKRAGSMTRLIDAAIKSVQRISSDLRPTLLDNLGLGAAVEWAAAEFQRRTKIRCQVRIMPADLNLDPQRSTALFRILQEALTNVLRHARATRIDVRLENDDGAIRLQVRDNGVGIPPARVEDPKSTGLAGMRERVLPWGGYVTFANRRGKGTDVVVTVPVKP